MPSPQVGKQSPINPLNGTAAGWIVPRLLRTSQPLTNTLSAPAPGTPLPPDPSGIV